MLSKGKTAVEMEDIKFHQCVRLARFENDRTISFIPPDGTWRSRAGGRAGGDLPQIVIRGMYCLHLAAAVCRRVRADVVPVEHARQATDLGGGVGRAAPGPHRVRAAMTRFGTVQY